MKLNSILAVAWMALGHSCTVVNGRVLDPADWEHSQREVKALAASELSCPSEALQCEALATSQGSDGLSRVTQIKASGCGRSATYQRFNNIWGH